MVSVDLLLMTGSKNPHLSENGEALSEIACGGSLIPSIRSLSSCPSDVYAVRRWFAAATFPRHEKRVEQHLRQRDLEHYLPVYRVQRKWRNGLKVTVDLPLFPGYIFVRIRRSDRVRVLEVPGVLAIVCGVAGEMAPLPETEVDALRSSLHLRHVEPHPVVNAGQRVRIRSGALSGLEGIVVRQKNSLRVVLTIDLIMQSIAVEVDGEELEPVDIRV